MRTLILALIFLAGCHPLDPATQRRMAIEDHCREAGIAASGSVASGYSRSFGYGGAAAGVQQGAAFDATYTECLQRNGIDPFPAGR